jgi:hypothetical protein
VLPPLLLPPLLLLLLLLLQASWTTRVTWQMAQTP